MTTLSLGMAAAPRADASTVAAVFPPWWSSSRTFAAADAAGQVIGAGAGRGVLIVRSDRSDLCARLRRAGALLLLDPLGLAACGDRRLQERSHA